MAIVPQGDLSVSNSVNSSGENVSYVDHEHGSGIDLGREFDTIRNLHLTIIKHLTDLDPTECVDGDCPTFEIPVILVSHDTPLDYLRSLGLTNPEVQLRTYPENHYELLVEQVTKVNDILSGNYSTIDGTEDSTYVSGFSFQCDPLHPKAVRLQGTGEYYLPFSNLGFYTGAQVFDEELGDIVDEYVRFADYRKVFPNIKFIFPKKIKSEYFLKGFHLDNNAQYYNVDIERLYGEILQSSLPEAFNQEYLYFPEETPGLISLDLSKFDLTYAQNCNFISNILSPQSTTNLTTNNISSFEGVRVPFLESTFLFSAFSYPYLTNVRFQNFEDNTQSSVGEPFSDKYQEGRIEGCNENTFIHEFAHAFLGTYHSWTLPTFGGTLFGVRNSQYQSTYRDTELDFNLNELTGEVSSHITMMYVNRKPGTGIVFPYTQGDRVEPVSDIVYTGEDLYTPNMFLDGHVLKPPFAYREKNSSFEMTKKLYEDAEAAYNDFEDRVSSGEIEVGASPYENIFYEDSNVKSYDLREALLSRKDALYVKYQNTPEYITGEFIDISEEEKGYVEFYLNRYIRHLTNNFTDRVEFVNGSSDGQVEASVSRGITGKKRTLLANTVYSGLQSFWGGSYVLNNPPALGSEYIDPVSDVAYKVINVKDQRYATVIKPLEGNITIAEAIEIIDSQSDSLWRYPTKEELDMLSSLYENDPGESIAIKIKNGLGLDFYITSIFLKPTYLSLVNRYVVVNAAAAADITVSEENNESFTSHLFMVKDIDLLEDDTISTSFVVNPTNDNGTRKGPNVTSYVPFCVPEDDEEGKPKASDTYDMTWYENLNSYNNKYPKYPDNTKVKDLFNEEYCPCLYKTQTFYNGSSTAFTYKIIEEGSVFRSLQELHKELGIEAPGLFYDYIIARFNFPVEIPDSFTTASDISRLYAPFLYRYNDVNSTILELAPPIGYYGFGYNTVLPNVYNINFREYYKLAKSSSEIEQYWEDCPDEFLHIKGGSPDYIYPQNLRISNNQYQATRDFKTAIRENTRTIYRYLVGSETVGAFDYNPLAKYYGDITSTGPSRAPDEINQLGDEYDRVLHRNLFATPIEEYHKDLYGEYNPLNMWHILQYPSQHSGIGSPFAFSDAEVKKLNYMFNSNLPYTLTYKTIAEESATPDASQVAVEIGNVVRLNGDDYLIFSIKNNVVIDQGIESGNVANEVFAVKISEGITGTLHDIYFYRDPFNEDAYNEGDYDFISYGISLQEMQDNYGFGSSNDDLNNHHFRELRSAFMAHPLDFNTTSTIYKIMSSYHTHLHYNRIVYYDYEPQWSWQPAHEYNYSEFVSVKNEYLSSVTLGRIDDTAELLNVLESNKNNIINTSLSSDYNNRRGFIFRKFFVTDERLQGPPQKYYIKDVMESVAEDISAYDIGSQIGGCTDATAFNFNPEATYDDGSCEAIVEGCTQSWADNYNDNANVDDGSCQATICLNTDATGEWGFGYNQSLIDEVNLYSDNAILPAVGSPVSNIDESLGNTVCQFLVQKRPAIIKVICLGVSEDLGSSVCNNNEVVRVIRDSNTSSISAYTNNPELVDINLQELITQVHVIGANPTTEGFVNVNNYPFADGISEYDIDADLSLVGNNTFGLGYLQVIQREVFLNDVDYINISSTTWGEKIFKYNCVENPILPDGSGGCLLYSFETQQGPLDYRLQGCTIPEVKNVSPSDCFTQTIFEGGYITDASIFNEEVSFVENSCKSNESKYIIPTNMNTSSNTLSVRTKDLLPIYSNYQISSDFGYPLDILRSAQLPPGVDGSLIEDPDITNISEVLVLINPNFLFTEDGVSYTGPYMYKIVNEDTNPSKVFYIHTDTNPIGNSGGTVLQPLFTRNQLLARGIANSEIELTANNFNEIVNEINNLTIFTDN